MWSLTWKQLCNFITVSKSLLWDKKNHSSHLSMGKICFSLLWDIYSGREKKGKKKLPKKKEVYTMICSRTRGSNGMAPSPHIYNSTISCSPSAELKGILEIFYSRRWIQSKYAETWAHPAVLSLDFLRRRLIPTKVNGDIPLRGHLPPSLPC